jgi:hypothetical protein
MKGETPGDNCKRVKMHRKLILKIFKTNCNRPNSIKLRTKDPWVKGFQKI